MLYLGIDQHKRQLTVVGRGHSGRGHSTELLTRIAEIGNLWAWQDWHGW
jgi:hypothetical protein